MNCIAKFDKVGYGTFIKDWMESDPYLRQQLDTIGSINRSDFLLEHYNSIHLPERATEGSAGYDFFMPMDMHFEPGHVFKFPTGIRCKMDRGWVLLLTPKSGLGFKYGTRLLNTIGVVDEDYYHSDNEGHIMVGLTVDKPLDIKAGQKIMQGIFLPYGITYGDMTKEKRNGGFGSTGK